jgi:hypothetical protein
VIHAGRVVFLPLALLLVFLQAVAKPDNAIAEYGGRTFFIERPQLALDLSYNFESEEREGPFIATKNTSHAWKERVDLQTAGWGYHPAFLTYTVGLSPEWEQLIEKPEPGSRRASDSFLLGYSLDLTFFPYKPVTLTLFGRRRRTELTSSLATRSETGSDTYGATLMLKNRTLPTTLAYVHTTANQTGFFDSEESRDEFRLQTRHEEKSNDTNLNAAYTAQDRTTPGTRTRTENFSGGAQNIYRITPDRRMLLNSGLTHRWSESDLHRSSGVSLSESLGWRHSKDFSTNYQLTHSSDSSGNTRVDTTSASAGLSHRLYENLATSASGRGSRTSRGENIYGGNLDFGYQRRIPWGMLYAGTEHDYTVTTRSVGAEFLPVIDEAHVLRTGDVTLLGNRNVELSSIVVTSADRSVVYLPDTDYRIEVLGTSVRISRTPFGAIADGQTVLVNYTYLSNPAFDDATYARSYGVGLYLWSTWRISYRYSRSEQDFLSGIPPDILNETTTQVMDTDLAWRWTATRMTWEDTDSTTGVSLTRWRASENLSFRPVDDVSFGLSGYYGETTLKETNGGETFFGFGSELQWRSSTWSKMSIESSYAKTDGTSNQTVDRAAAARLEWFYGIWSGEFSYRFLNEEDRTSDQSRNRHSAYAAIKRRLY